ncbi:hypothetical protein Q9L58_007446 [Maublancomyces gigas]|uniref:DUF676 domain-containing protein n=1 Tax=Discina gigas TaxID=1032678 RepID=A0ABR3GCC8_9PEZI
MSSSRFRRFIAPFKRSPSRTPSPAPPAPQSLPPISAPASTPTPSPPVSAPVSSPDHPPPPVNRDIFRITGIPLSVTLTDLTTVISSTFSSEGITLDESQSTLCLSPDQRSQTALVQFMPRTPKELERLRMKDVCIVDMDAAAICIDKDFYGLTQMYATEGDIKAEYTLPRVSLLPPLIQPCSIVAVCGLNGHAYGSWAGKKDVRGRRKMWLRHFLSQDLPQCRTMIYGYDSSLKPESRSIHSIPDYTDSFLEELKKARTTDEEKERPIIFIGHSFGGIIIAQSIVKAKDFESLHGTLFSRARATLFFGTPHRGMLVEDILTMIGDDSHRATLVKSLETGSVELQRDLKRFINYSVIIKLKIINFREIELTRKLEKGEDGKWSRSGDYFTAVDAESSVLQLPDTIEESLAVEGDHSSMVKFKHKGDQTYKSVVRYLEDFTSYSTQIEGPITAYKAIKSKNAADLKRALQQPRVHLNEIHEGRTTLLHMAMANHDQASAVILLGHGANIDVRDKDDNTPLHRAVRDGEEWAINMLLENGADLAATCLGMSALHIVASSGDERIAGLLLDKGSNIEMISTDEAGFTPLQFAARDGHVGMIAMLLRRGAGINAIGVTMDTPLHVATWEGNDLIVEFLLASGSDITVADINGCSVLHFAAFRGHRKLMLTLLSRGADKNARDLSGRTPLLVAALNGHLDIVEILLEAGVDLTCVSVNSQTALHLAAKNGKEGVVQLLLKNGADIRSVDISGGTALEGAILGGHHGVVELLRAHQIQIDGES